MSSSGRQTMNIGRDPETLANLEKQHEMVDTQMRSTAGIDYTEVRQQAHDLIKKRKEGMSKGQITSFARTKYPAFCSKFPHFLQSIAKDCETNRLDEFAKVLDSLLDGLEKVQSGDMSQSELRNNLFEKQLATKYFRPK